jgi:hypothetical protein
VFFKCNHNYLAAEVVNLEPEDFKLFQYHLLVKEKRYLLDIPLNISLNSNQPHPPHNSLTELQYLLS